MSKRYIPKIYSYDGIECGSHITVSKVADSISVNILEVSEEYNHFLSKSYSISESLYNLIVVMKDRFSDASSSYEVKNLMANSTVVADVNSEIVEGGNYGF